MKYKFITTMVLVLLFVTALAAYAEQGPSLQEGMKPYIPTRLEWLAVELNAMHRTDLNDLEGYMLFFIPLEKENAILIFVRYTQKTNREAMNIGIDTARKVIEMDVKSRGWNSWLKVKERIELADTNKGS
jgi:hypothetical protein